MLQSEGPTLKRTGGGAATSAGVEFQSRVTAWLAVRILAESEAQPLWDWPNQSILRFLRCETEQPVDDILVGNSIDDLAFIQVKRTISAGSSSESQLASVFSQFARQYLRPTISADVSLPWSRSFDANRDRLILAIGKESSATISEHLRGALTRLRQLPDTASLDDPSFNQSERDILQAVRLHLNAAWSATEGKPADAFDLVSLLRATYIEVIDAEPLGFGEREAKELLRRSILEQPGQADLAWAKIIELCTAFTRSRGGAGQPELTRALAASGVALKVAPSYRRDVAKLRAYSQQTVKILARFSDIRIEGTTRIKIDRASTVELRTAAKASSLLVIGEPGAGKSGALHDLARDLLNEGAEVLCIATDEVAATSMSDLAKELGIEHPLADVIANWGGPSRLIYFITDALDAARSDHASEMFRNVIENALELTDSCRVIASIRMFDLRHDSRLRTLFNGKPYSSASHPEFGNIRHFLVPGVNDDELRQLAAQSKPLDRLVQAVLAENNQDMRRLIAVPFNLRLLGELVGEGIEVESLTPIRTQIDLLDRYWRARVLREGKDKLGDARETVLRKVARSMFDNRLLHAPRSIVNAGPEESALLQSLLSSDVLQEYRPGALQGQGSQTLKFPHHLLFDYALSRLLMRVEHNNLAVLIAADPDCVVAFRPSLVLHFRHLWEDNPTVHDSFWALLLLLNQNADIPLVGKIIGPAEAAGHFKDLKDLAPLLAAIKESVATEDGRRPIVRVVSYLIGAQAAKEGIRRDDGGVDAARWAEVAAMLAEFVEVMAYPLRHLLMLICNPPEGIPDLAKPKTGEAGRCLLAYALQSDDQYDGSLVRVAMEAVARTFSSDSTASHAILARLVETEHATKHGHTELFFCAQEVRWLLPYDPTLVGHIYKIAFTAASDSDEKTNFGGVSRIVPLTSTVRQDWEGVHYALAESFPDFISQAPREAIGSAMAAVASYVEQKHPRTDPEPATKKFMFLGESTTITVDFSSIWDSEGVASRDGNSAMELLGAVTRHLGMLDAAADKVGELTDLLKLVARNAHHAVVWRRLLQAGVEHPERLGKLLAELVTCNAVLECFDTMEPVGDLLTAVYADLGPEERSVIESGLLAFASREGAQDTDERLGDRYLGCLPRELVITEKARERLVALDEKGGPPPNTPHFRMSGFEESNVSDEEFLRHQGVPVDEPANRRLLDLIRPLKTKGEASKPLPAGTEEHEKRLERLRAIKAALEDNVSDAVVSEVKQQALGHLANACATALKTPADPSMTELKDFSRELLLEIAASTPEGELQTNDQFDELPSWGSPDASIAAAEGLLLSKDELTPALQEKVDAAVDRLMRSPEPEVRFQVARYAGAYSGSNEQRMWSILKYLAENDPSGGVLTAVMGTISRTRSATGVGLAEQIFKRSKELAQGDSVREMCLSYFLMLQVYQGFTPSVWIHLEPIAKAPWLHFEDAQRLISGLRDSLAFGSAEPETEANAQLRKRGQELFRLIVQSASDEFSRLVAEYQSPPIPDEIQRLSNALQRIIQVAANQIYFASGAFSERTPSDKKERLTTAQRRRFWIEMQGVIRLLSDSQVPSISYYLTETLETLIPFDPKAVFLEISRTVQCGKAGGFQFESLLADLAVRLVREFIATHRALLKSDKECRRALIDVLDIFVEAGWPAAQKLTFGLQDIFR